MKTNYQTKKLGDIGDIKSGGTPSTKRTDFFGGNVPWLTPADLSGYSDTYVSQGKRNLTEAGLRGSSAYLLPAGTVLCSSRAPIGYVAIAKNEIATNQGFKNIVPNKGVYNKYLYHYLKGNKELLESRASGTTFKELSAKRMANIPIPLPPLPEQKRIVAILDEVFADIDKAKDNAEKNLMNAREVFESYLQGVFSNLGEDWQTKKIGDVCIIKPPKKESKGKLSQGDLVSFVPMKNLQVLQRSLTLVEDRPLKDVYKGYVYFADGDVILAKITPCFENGKLGIARNLTNGIGFGSSEFVPIRSKGKLIPEYLFYFLSQDSFRETGCKIMTGASGHLRVPKDYIENTEIPLPPLSEQKQIVSKLDSLSSEVKRLEKIYERKVLCLEELRKSVLDKAFKGEL